MTNAHESSQPVPVFYDELAAKETVDILAEVLGPTFELFALSCDEKKQELELAARATFILAGWRPVPAEVIEASKGLLGIHKLGAGLDKISLGAASERGVTVTVSAGLNANQVAEHTILLLLGVLRRLPELDRSVRKGRWLKNELRPRLRRLTGRRVGIIGMGHIGQAVATRLRAFECRLAYHDVSRLSREQENELGIAFVNLDDLLSGSEIITLHLPSTPSTQGLLDRDRLGTLPKGAVIVNTSRGDVIDQGALIELLRSGHIGGAGIDVYAQEPPPMDDPLLALDNVVLTPHVAGSSREGIHDLGVEAKRILDQILAGQVPSEVVDVHSPKPPLRGA